MSAEPPQGLREALADALVAALPERTGGPDRFYRLARADAFLAGPLAPRLAAQEAVERVEELTSRSADALYPPIWVRAVRRALDGDQC
jgi:2-methylisocitrate lyase-like PEP mutase family enzyme